MATSSGNASVDDGLVQEYLAESQEHLATIETDLLILEQDGEAIQDEVVNRVFRAAHSIKGGAGFFDLVRIRELAHKAESVLELMRSRQLVPNAETVSVLLLAFDKLREMLVDYRASGEADISEYVQALNALSSPYLPQQAEGGQRNSVPLAIPNQAKRIEIGVFDLEQARRGGRSIYLVEYDLIHDLQRRNQSPLEVLRGLMRAGTIISTSLDLESAGSLETETSRQLMLEVLYACALEADLIGGLLNLPAKQIKLLEKNGILRDLEAGLEAAPDIPQASAPPAKAAPADLVARKSGGAESTLRLPVELLDNLMTLAGELVLSRNELQAAVAAGDETGIRAGSHRLSLVTSELQSAVTLTRMQPIGSLLGKFPRLVRDLSRNLGKQVRLEISGEEVEIDKTILEGLSDPLTHMIRNAVDHGIELPEERLKAGKAALGTVWLRASHQAGQVVLEIRDDGKGLSAEKIGASTLAKGLIGREQLEALSEREKIALLFLPGVSTAEKLSDVSGRGVGMDVVKTNLDRLGGKVEIDSTRGEGTTFRIKLPLTLAIIPSLLISCRGQRFAIPQQNVGELLRIPASQWSERVDRAGHGEVLLLRDRLVPLLRLADALGEPTRAAQAGQAGGGSEPGGPQSSGNESRSAQLQANQTIGVVLVHTGGFEYGLVVDELHDTAEIVVKPLGRHLKQLTEYAGAAILGDGEVALILDVGGVAQGMGPSLGLANMGLAGELAQEAASGRAPRSPKGPAEACEAPLNAALGRDGVLGEQRSLLLFHNAPGERCAVPIELVNRIERVRPEQIQMLGGRRTMRYGQGILPLWTLGDAACVGNLDESQSWVVIVFDQAGRTQGLLAAEPMDMIQARAVFDLDTLRQRGIAGSGLLEGKTTLLVDLLELAGQDSAKPAERAGAAGGGPGTGGGQPEAASPLDAGLEAASRSNGAKAPTILVAEDSDFFRGQIRRMIEAVGYQVLAAPDGQAAWELLDAHAGVVGAVATDLEMPRMDGLALTQRIRADQRFARLPIIALSSLAGEEEIAEALAAGVTEYQVKLDQEAFLEGIRRVLEDRASARSPESSPGDRAGSENRDGLSGGEKSHYKVALQGEPA